MRFYLSITAIFAFVCSAQVVYTKQPEDLTEDLFPQQEIEEKILDGYGLSYGAELNTIEVQLAQNGVDNFVTHLRQFVNDTNFNYVSFEYNKETLVAELADITIAVARVSPTRSLSHSLRFAHHEFQIMDESSYLMNLYKDFRYPGYSSVYHVVEVGVLALSLSDSHGSLDFTIKGYLGKLVRIYHNLYKWVGSFRIENSYVPWGTKRLFDFQVSQVESTLEDLRSWVPI